MIANRLFGSSLKTLTASPFFAFSAKKKQIELTLRTPYRIQQLTQAPSSRISPDSARLSRRISPPWW
jgi:hypothetical protein